MWKSVRRIFLQRGQNAKEAQAGREDGLSDAPEESIDRRHGQAGSAMDKCDHSAADDAAARGRYKSHHQYQYGEEASKLVPAQRHKCHQGGAGVYKYRWEEGPQKDMVPHLAERVEPRLGAQPNHIDNGVQLIGIDGFRVHGQQDGQAVSVNVSIILNS